MYMCIYTHIHTYVNVKTANSNFLYFVNISNNNSIQFKTRLFTCSSLNRTNSNYKKAQRRFL